MIGEIVLCVWVVIGLFVAGICVGKEIVAESDDLFDLLFKLFCCVALWPFVLGVALASDKANDNDRQQRPEADVEEKENDDEANP